ncbi:ORF6N domain-containing protein [Mycoplasmopsis californica]|nr:ORF6N domain-containing protein [Mycoplasmopsis californica]
MTKDKNLIIVDNIEIQNIIYTIRGKWVMLDSGLAELYRELKQSI